MSQLIASIIKINTLDGLNIVQFDFLGIPLKMMSLDLSKDIQVGKKVLLGVKSTNISLSKLALLKNRLIIIFPLQYFYHLAKFPQF